VERAQKGLLWRRRGSTLPKEKRERTTNRYTQKKKREDLHTRRGKNLTLRRGGIYLEFKIQVGGRKERHSGRVKVKKRVRAVFKRKSVKDSLHIA